MQPVPVLFIENSVGVSGSMVSLTTLLSRLDLAKFMPYVVVSLQEQYDYIRSCVPNIVNLKVIHPRSNSKEVSWIVDNSRISIGIFQRALSWINAVLETCCVTLPYAFQLYRYARSNRIRLVHHNNGFDVASILMSRLLDIPIIPYQRGDEWNSLLVRIVSRSVAKYIANSETTRKSLLNLGLPASKIVTIYPAADVTAIDSRRRSEVSLRHFGIDASVPCFGVVGMILPWKGQDIFLRAAKIVLEELPTARAFVVGGPPAGELDYLMSLKNLAGALKLDNRVIFTGFRADVLDIMELLHVIVHTSVQPEPFGRVVLEAMALKKPVIASNEGGPKEIVVHGETGLLIPPGNPEALAEAILLILRDALLSKRLAEAGYHLAKNRFSIDGHVEAVQGVYRSVLNEVNA